MVGGFIAFLKQYGVIGLAIAVIIGGKLNDFIKAFVDGLIMPLIGLMIPGGEWRQAAFTVTTSNGETKFLYGPVMGSTLDFLIVALIVYVFAKKVLKEAEVTKK